MLKPKAIRVRRRILLLLGSPRDLVGVHLEYTPRGELAIYLDS